MQCLAVPWTAFVHAFTPVRPHWRRLKQEFGRGRLMLASPRSGRRSADACRTVASTRAISREGDISSLELLDAERTVADTQAALADADARIARAQIDLFRSLGGDWAGA